MAEWVGSRQTATLIDGMGPLLAFLTEGAWLQRRQSPGVADFVVGDPHEMPLPAFVEALQRAAVPQHEAWFAYPVSLPAAQAAVAESLRSWRGLPFEADDIMLTNGGFAAITVALRAVVDPGDEVIFISPPWFFYETLIRAAGAEPVRVPVRPADFDLDLPAIAAAITPRTRAIIVNSPNNPTGVIYSPATLTALAEVLTAAAERHGRPIYLLSDEAYARIVFDGRPYHSPTAYYPNTLLLYTYGKTLLTPGQRLGYIALPPTMPGRASLRLAILTAQLVTGYAWPNALLQHALPELERLSIDIAHLQRKRDTLVASLREIGYAVHVPAGTFYLLPRSPWADDLAFTDLLVEHDVLVLPGTLVELPGYVRLSLTANDDMIAAALPRFAAALREATTRRQA